MYLIFVKWPFTFHVSEVFFFPSCTDPFSLPGKEGKVI